MEDCHIRHWLYRQSFGTREWAYLEELGGRTLTAENCLTEIFTQTFLGQGRVNIWHITIGNGTGCQGS